MRIVSLNKFQTLDSLRKRVAKVRYYEPLWRYYRLVQYVPAALGINGLGLVDIPPDIVFGKLVAGESEESLKRCILRNWRKQIRKGGTTINFEMERHVGNPDILQYTEQILKLREQEMERVIVYTGGKNVNLKALWLTAWGYKVLSTLNLDTWCSRKEFDLIETALNKIGVSVKKNTETEASSAWGKFLHQNEYPVNMSKGLANCIWNVVERDIQGFH
jgi:hypothetical protein